MMTTTVMVSQKKRKAVKKKKIGVRPVAPPPPDASETSQFVAPVADAHIVLDEMLTSFNDDTYMSTMSVGSNNWSQTNEVDEDGYEVDYEGEGLIGAPKGRTSNYTVDEDKLLCNTWLNVSMDPIVGTDQTRDTYWLRMKEFFDTSNKE
ncbi:putative receptor protein kinase ZmPK1 [Hordeum vulgare]|nr:putative receptor protein kinase ZmPK1 [Hordeum vulgare]